MAHPQDMGPQGPGINLGAVAGAVVGSIGGLFSVGIPPAIVYRDIRALFETPKIALICFVVGGALGWIMGGLIGPRLGRAFANPWAEVGAGAASGLVPILMILVWSYYMVTS